MNTPIHTQLPEKKASDVIKVIQDELNDEVKHYEKIICQNSFRGDLLRKLLNKIEKIR